ncbi:MAG: cupin [Verrucomicrobiaceae bacterium]|nr:cupin [Verrucomicrobiaceae bacterium]
MQEKQIPFRIWFDNPSDYQRQTVAAFQHSFSDHPLLQLPRLQQLAESLLESGQCKFISTEATQASPFDTLNRNPDGRSIADIFARIEEPGSWISMYNVETDPEYKQFLWDALTTVRPLIDKQDPGMFNVGGFIFVSAPPSVTPFHIDRENNFWLQIRGRKQINVWNPRDRVSVSEQAVENFITQGDLAAVRFSEDVRSRSFAAEMGPGGGVYMPSTAAHTTRAETTWVTPGDGYAISIAMVFYTQKTRREANLYALNHFLRARGLNPTPPGQSAWLDAIKYPLARAFVLGRKYLRGYEPRVGM